MQPQPTLIDSIVTCPIEVHIATHDIETKVTIT